MQRFLTVLICLIVACIAGQWLSAGSASSPETGFVQPGLRHLAEAARPGFLVGTHLKYDQLDGRAAEIVLGNYNQVSVGIYQKQTQRRSRDSWDFTSVDPVIEFAEKNNLTVYAHPMFGSDNYIPDWMLDGDYSNDEVLEIMEERIRTILTRYRGKIDILDVYNEGFFGNKEGWRGEDNFLLRLGFNENEIGRWPVALEKILFWCRQYGGDDLKLVYNDNHNSQVGLPQSDECLRLFRALEKEGIPIDGIGIQLHTKIGEDNVHYLRGSPELKQHPFDPVLFAENIREYGRAGAEVYISECDVHLYGEVDDEKLAVQAEAFRSMLQVCMSEPACKGFKTWGFTDASCWKPLAKQNPGLEYEPRPLVFDHDLNPKPAYHAMMNMLAGLTAGKTAMKENVDFSGKPAVGVYYYPWYRKPDLFSNRWERAMRLHLEEPHVPMSGLYDSRDPRVIGDHIEQSLRGGIDFWAVSWWGPDHFTDEAFRKHILKHPESGKLKYAILYESTGRFGSFDSPDYSNWLKDLQYFRDTFWDDPRYLRVDGKPVVFVYLTRVYFRQRAGEVLKAMRQQFPELYLVGDDVFFASGVDSREVASARYKSEWAGNFDAVTAYDVYGQSIKQLGGTGKAVEVLAANYSQARSAANRVGTAFIPAIAPGYNDTAVRDGHPGRARYFTDDPNSGEGDIFRDMIRRVALPNLDARSGNMLVITSFNEWYEDTQIEPTSGTAISTRKDDSDSGTFYTGGDRYVDYGYLYLDILKEEISK